MFRMWIRFRCHRNHTENSNRIRTKNTYSATLTHPEAPETETCDQIRNYNVKNTQVHSNSKPRERNELKHRIHSQNQHDPRWSANTMPNRMRTSRPKRNMQSMTNQIDCGHYETEFRCETCNLGIPSGGVYNNTWRQATPNHNSIVETWTCSWNQCFKRWPMHASSN